MKIRILKTALVLIAVLSICSCKGKEGGNSSKSSKGPDLTVANPVLVYPSEIEGYTVVEIVLDAEKEEIEIPAAYETIIIPEGVEELHCDWMSCAPEIKVAKQFPPGSCFLYFAAFILYIF